MKPIKLTGDVDETSLQEVGKIVRSGGVIVYPADTIYGFGCDPFSRDAMNRIYAMKGKPFNCPLLILLDSAGRLEEWCDEIPDYARTLIDEWPAPLTLVFSVRPGTPDFITRGGTSLGFRVPDSGFCRRLSAACGGSITSTSVNRSDGPPLGDPSEIAKQFGGEIDVLVDAGVCAESLPSTVVSCVAEKPELVRTGKFSIDI